MSAGPMVALSGGIGGALRDRTVSGRTTSPSVFAAGRFRAAVPDRR